MDVILEGLAWLGLTPDEPPLFQSTRAARHAETVQTMLASGHAYRCYASAEELRQMRELATAEGRPPRYDGRWRDRDPAEAPEGTESPPPFACARRAKAKPWWRIWCKAPCGWPIANWTT